MKLNSTFTKYTLGKEKEVIIDSPQVKLFPNDTEPLYASIGVSPELFTDLRDRGFLDLIRYNISEAFITSDAIEELHGRVYSAVLEWMKYKEDYSDLYGLYEGGGPEELYAELSDRMDSRLIKYSRDRKKLREVVRIEEDIKYLSIQFPFLDDIDEAVFNHIRNSFGKVVCVDRGEGPLPFRFVLGICPDARDILEGCRRLSDTLLHMQHKFQDILGVMELLKEIGVKVHKRIDARDLGTKIRI